MTSSVLAPLTHRHRRVQSEAIATKMSRLRRRDLHKVGAKAACVDAAAAYVDVAGLRASMWPGSPSHKVAGPDEGQVDSMRLDLHKSWCKKPRARTRWLRMWTWPDSSSTW